MNNLIIKSDYKSDNKYPYVLVNRFYYDDDKDCAYIPKGFRTDFATITWIGHLFVKSSKLDRFAIIHDYLIYVLLKKNKTTRIKGFKKWLEINKYVQSHLKRCNINRFQFFVVNFGILLGAICFKLILNKGNANI